MIKTPTELHCSLLCMCSTTSLLSQLSFQPKMPEATISFTVSAGREVKGQPAVCTHNITVRPEDFPKEKWEIHLCHGTALRTTVRGDEEECISPTCYNII